MNYWKQGRTHKRLKGKHNYQPQIQFLQGEIGALAT